MAYVALNEDGRRICETHHRAVYSDAFIERIRSLHEDEFWSYGRIAMHLHISQRTVGKVCRYEVRNQYATRWRRE